MNLKNKPFFCSWSGGKDSCLALYYAMRRQGDPHFLVTMMIEEGIRSRSHGLSLSVLEKQAELLNIKLVTRETSWQNYEKNFVEIMDELKAGGVKVGVFGDIDLDEHRDWVERVCKRVGIEAVHPLWQMERGKVFYTLIDLGFKAVIVAVNEKKLDPDFLGRELDDNLKREFLARGIDPAGENGEFHTIITGGPIFTEDMEFRLGGVLKKENYWFQDILV